MRCLIKCIYKPIIILLGILHSGDKLTLYHTIPILSILKKKALENNVGKEENAGNQHFLLFP